jgi:hypothetical protein
MKKLNPNAEVPFPKTIAIKKLAVSLEEYDHTREHGARAVDLSQPADPLYVI